MKQNRWDDYFTRRAREENWLARSVFKLQEMDKKFNVIRKGDRLLDLGCYPGSWLQYAVKKAGPEGEVTGIDLIRPDRLSHLNIRFIHADVLTLDIEWLAKKVDGMDVVMSDLAPQTTGIRSTDASRSMLLARRAAEIAVVLLKKKGRFVCKVFEEEGLRLFKMELSDHFRQTRLFRPKAVRKRSREIYLLGLNKF